MRGRIDIVWHGAEFQGNVYIPLRTSHDDYPEVDDIRCTGIADESEWEAFVTENDLAGSELDQIEQAMAMFEDDIRDAMISKAKDDRPLLRPSPSRFHKVESVERVIDQLVEGSIVESVHARVVKALRSLAGRTPPPQVANIIAQWYENEGSEPSEITAEYLSSDLGNMLDAASNGKERAIVVKFVNTYLGYDYGVDEE